MSRPEHRPAGPPGSGVSMPDIVTLARTACERDPGVPAIVFEDGVELSRPALMAGVEQFGGYLRDVTSRGDRVAVMLPNRAEFWIAWLAAAANGAVIVSMNPAAGPHDAGHMLRDSGAVVAVVDEERRELVERLAPSCPALREVVVLGAGEPGGLLPYASPAGPLDLAAARVDPDAVTNVYYTSGTTGPPKGCMLGHDYWTRFVDLYLRLYGLGPEDRMLCCLQFFYGDPPWQLLASLHAGTTLVAMRRFSVSRFWDVARAHGTTQVYGLASIPSLLLKAPPSPADRDHGMRLAVQVGVPASLHAELHRRWGFPWLEAYGLTETGIVVAMPPEHAEEMTGTGAIGVPVPEASIRLVDEDGADVAAGAVGEVLVSAPGLFRGYLGRPDLTAETLRDGWLHTGDLARADERGFLYFMGRRKDIIRRSGENVSAAEVEAVLRSHPMVLEAAVVPVPDELRGEEVKAHVLLVDGTTRADLPPERLVELCAAQLARHKIPRYIEYRERPFPLTPSMRVLKRELLAERDDQTAGSWDRERDLAS
jgi:carnitine-CoA ligase